MSIEEHVARLVDEAAIRDATARFADAATRNDLEAFRGMWVEGAEWSIGEHVHDVGVDDIVMTFRQLRDERNFFVQFAIQGPISIDGDVATASVMVHEAASGPGDAYYRNHAVASDVLHRTGERWLFAKRSFEYVWLDTSPFTGEGFNPTRHSSET